MQPSSKRVLNWLLLLSSVISLTACNDIRNVTVSVSGGKYVTGSTTPATVPIPGAVVEGQWDYDIADANPEGGTVYSFNQTTNSERSIYSGQPENARRVDPYLGE